MPTLIIEQNARPGDAWRKRYNSLCLHDPVWYDHLPYLPFPDHWPVFTPKDKMGDWLEMYARVMELNYWSLTECSARSYDEAAKEWTVVVDRDGERVTLRPKQLVLATGMSGCRTCRASGRRDASRASSIIPASIRSGEDYAGQDVRRHRLEQFRARYLRRPVGARRRGHHGPALADVVVRIGHADASSATGRFIRRRR